MLTPNVADSEEQKERFVRAMKTMMPIRHPNIVQLYNAGKKGPYCWAAMEFIEGESLASVIDQIGVQGMLDWRDVWRVAVHIGRALREAYERKIIHRNVTPTNILKREQGGVYLLGDLMLAKALEGSLAKQVTQPGQVIGDVPYMPPERTRDGAQVDGRADIYGLGATCYALLTGHPPFESDSLPEIDPHDSAGRTQKAQGLPDVGRMRCFRMSFCRCSPRIRRIVSRHRMPVTARLGTDWEIQQSGSGL